MLLPIFILCLSHLALASPVQRQYDVEDIEQLKYHFNDFKVKYNKAYTAEEERLRFKYFKENLVKINELNIKNPLTVYGINKFTDWSAEEIERLSGFGGADLGDDGLGLCTDGLPPTDIKTGSFPPDSIDWRDRNAVAPVQNQGVCDSSWAFSAAAVLEGAYALKHNTLLKLSEQQFVDCDTESYGCKGGWPHAAISSTIQQGGGQLLEKDYPYKERVQECEIDVKAQVNVTSCKVYRFLEDTDDKLASLLASTGPLSVGVSSMELAFYKGGILTHCEGVITDLAVTLVGYGNEGGVPYWIIKNSWGTGWGENGYARVKKGVICLSMGGYVLTAEVA